MKRFLFLLLLCISFLLYPQEQKQDSQFCTATFNMNWGNVNLGETVRVIKETKADIVALQEVTEPAVRHFKKHLKKEYPFMSFKPDVRAGGFGFLSKVKLNEVGFTRGQGCPFGVYSAIAEFGGKNVQFLNVHFCPMFPGEKDTAGKIFNIFAKTEEVHRIETAYVLSLLKENRTVILGDFNSASFMHAPIELRNNGFTDSFASVTDNPETHVTWHWNFQGQVRQFRIDYIFHSRYLKTLTSRVIRHNSSDHFPVVSRLSFVKMDESSVIEKDYKTRKGTSVPYFLIKPKTGNVKGVFVYMHGAGNDRREGLLDIVFKGTFQRLKKTLTAKGYVYVCPDTSDFTSTGGRELAELTRYLKKKYNVPVFAAGSSAGARTVWECLKTSRHGLSGAILLGPAISKQAFGPVSEIQKKPVYMIQGLEDRTIQPGTIGLLNANLLQNGFSVEFKQIPGGHAEPVSTMDWEEALRFLEKNQR